MAPNRLQMVLLGIVTIAIMGTAYADRTYTITAPKNVRVGTPYQVVVSIHNTPEDVEIFANLSCSSDDGGKPQLTSGTISVPNEVTKILTLEIPDWWKPGSCELTVSGDKGIVFKRSASLGFNSKTSSIFIQTDKAIYQPGQLVQFRVLVVDPNLKPYQSDDLTVYITDAQGNRIKQWNNATLKSGIFSQELQLSDQPVLGDWSINAQLKDAKTSKQVTIAEYVLPKFEVTIRPPNMAIFNDSELVVGVEAKYTYGKPVKGKLVLNTTESYCRSPYSSYCGSTPVVVRTDIDGTATVKIPMTQFNFPDYYRNSQANLDFLAVVTEDLTGRTMNTSAQGNIYSKREKIEVQQSTSSFKPGLPHNYKIKLQFQDGSPVTNANALMTVKTQSSHSKPEVVTNYTVPSNGVLSVDAFPDEDAEFLRLNVEYKDVSGSAYANKAQSISTKYLQLSLHDPKTKDPKVGDTVQMDVNGTFYISRLDYEVVARGKIVSSGSLKFDKDAKSHSFPLTLTQDMAPRVRIVAYYVSSCGEVVADSLDFSVDGVFQTPVELHTSENKTKPGAPLEVRVDTLPNATVGLLAIDQSVLLLKSGNDLNSKEIVNDLGEYESGWRPSIYDRKKRSIWRPPGDTVSQLFDNAGLVFFSNGLFQKQPDYGYGGYRPYLFKNRVGGFTTTRPPLAMATSLSENIDSLTESGSARPAADKPTIRQHFPETWIWSDITSGPDGKAVLKTTVPDTITSWQLSAFAMDDENGLGLADGPSKVEVFRPFFVTLNLPYSVVRGESVAIQALVFNYMKEDVEAEVTLENLNDQFELTGLLNRVDVDHNATSEKKNVKVKAGDGSSVSFLITPKVVGHIDLTVSAVSSKAGDALNRKLLVKAEGSPQYFNKAVLVDLRNSPNFESLVNVTIPPFAVKDSEHVEVSAIGDIMGPTVNNLDKLIKMPYGCGEQNMVNFVPNIAVSDYLNTTNQLTEKLRNKAVKFMEAGYQRELTYKRSDGSFSAFGASDKAGSTWLTAFVARSFKQAKPYISVDDNVIDSALKFLERTYVNDSFHENGNVHSKTLQGGASDGLALTAYVTLTFLENSDKSEYHNVTKRAVKQMEERVSNVEDPYELAIITYALHKANSPTKDAAFERLLKKADKKGDVVSWKKPSAPRPANSSYFYYPPPSVDIEMTAYALLSHLERGLVTESIPIMRWMVTQRNENGGFASTQDTVVGIQALASMASHITSPDGAKMDVDFEYSGRHKRLTLDKENAMVLQREDLPSETREIAIKAEGKGVGIVQVTWSYNLDNQTQSPVFDITPKVKQISKDSFDLTVCAIYEGEGEDKNSNMAVIELNLPSGYVVDGESLPHVGEHDRLKRVDTVDGGTKVQIYYDQINDVEVCPHITAYRTFPVANVKPAAVSVYDYYENDKRAETFYDAPTSDLCDICSGDECAAKCKGKPKV